MKIFTSDQIREIDDYTIKNEPVPSFELMERAAGKLLLWYINKFDRMWKIHIFAGPGNNGGDGLALARMLAENRYEVELYYIKFTEKTSPDWELNFQRLKRDSRVTVKTISSMQQFPLITSDDVIIDAILGSGLNRAVDGLPKKVIQAINKTDALRISIDIPSGLFGEDNSNNDKDAIIMADYTLCFQFPKLAFMFAENAKYLGNWEVIPIGLSETAIRNISTPYRLVGQIDIIPLLKPRKKFDHKGIYGHGLLVAGSKGKMGAAVLAAKAALRSGIGLLTCCLPASGRVILQTSVPEAMVIANDSEDFINNIDTTGSYTATGIGPGIGNNEETVNALYAFLKANPGPVVIDADALNIMSANKKWFSMLHPGVIITPHPKEFERLAGKSENGYERLQRQLKFSKDNNCIVVLKGACTSITTPEGNVSFNSSGNPGMATAGSGDVLTGIILSLLSQGYTAGKAAVAGAYIHGLAGDIAAEKSCYESLIASDIIKNIGNAYNRIRDLDS